MNLDEIEKENTMRVLKEEPIVKLCCHCKHMIHKYGHDKCIRNHELKIHAVTGKRKFMGPDMYCEIEREVENTYTSLVNSGDKCGAIGQYWELDDRPKAKGRFHWLTKRFKKNA